MYAHFCGIKVIFCFSWCWDVACNQFSLETINENSQDIFKKYEKEYSCLNADGIYFQSFTELKNDSIGGILIAKAVFDFVNNTSKLFFEKYPFYHRLFNYLLLAFLNESTLKLIYRCKAYTC